MANIDATLRRQFFELAQRQWTMDLYHHHQADDPGGTVGMRKLSNDIAWLAMSTSAA
jgi:hypothetical protein